MEQDLAKEPTTSPKKTPVNVTSKLSQAGASSSAAKVVVFTPEQLQKLDFAKQLQDVINKQVNPLYINENKRGPYKKRHPKLVKSKITKPKIISKEQSSETIANSLKQKFSQVVKLDKNFLLDSINSESSAPENIPSGKSDVRDEDVVKYKSLNVNEQVIQETVKLKRQILNKNEVDNCDAKDDINKSSKPSDDIVVEEQVNIKEEVMKDLFNVKIRQTSEAVKEVQQSKEEEAIPEVANSNESQASLNGSEINEEVMAVPEVLTMIEEKEDIKSELIQNKKNIISDETKSSEIVQVNKQLNEANVSFKLGKPHQTEEQSVIVGETMEEIAEEVKQINADQKQRMQETKIDGTKEKGMEEENKITCINQNIQEIKELCKEEIVQTKSLLRRRNSRKKTEENCDEPREEFIKLHEQAEVVDKNQKEEEELVPAAKQLSTRRQSARKHKGRARGEAEENEIGQIQDFNEEFGIPNVGQLKSPSQRRLSVRIDYAKDNGNIQEVKKLHETEKPEDVPGSVVINSIPVLTRRQSVNKDETDEEFAVSNFGELKSPSKRRLSLRIDYAKSNENIEGAKKSNEAERQSVRKSETEEEEMEECGISNVGQLKSPARRRLSVRIDYEKGKKLIEEEKEKALIPEIVQAKALLTRRQSLRKDKVKEQEIETAEYLNDDAGQLKSPSKRRLSLRIDYVKNNENIKEAIKLTEEEKEVTQNKRSNLIAENEKVVSIVPEVVQSNPLLTRRKSEGNSDKRKDEVDRRRPSITNENAKSSLRISRDTRTDNEEEKCEEDQEGIKAAHKEIVQLKPRRQSGIMSEKEKNTTKKNNVGEVSSVNQNRRSEILNEKKPLKKSHLNHTDNKEKQLNENERDGAHPEIVRLKLQLKEKEENHNRSETKEDVIEEAEELEENETSQLDPLQRSKSANIVDPKSTDTEVEPNKVKLRTYQNRNKKGLKNNGTKEKDQKPNERNILKSLELIPSQKTDKTDDLESFKINEIITEDSQHEEAIADSCSVEKNHKMIQSEETEKKKCIQIVTNEVVFFSPSDIQNMTKNPKSKPVALAADPALVILQKSVNLQEVIILENKSETEKLNEETELILKEEKAKPRCYARKNKTNFDQNLFAQGNKKSEKVSTTVSTDSTCKDGDEVKVEEEKLEFVNLENTLSKNVDEPSETPIVENRSKSHKKLVTSNETNLPKQIDAIQIKSGIKRKLATSVESDNTEFLQNTSGERESAKKSTLTSNTEVIETVVSEQNLSVNAEAIDDNSLSSKTTKSARNKEIKQNLTRKSRRFKKSPLTSNIEMVETEVPEENLPVNSEAHQQNSRISGTTKLGKNTEILQKSPKKTSSAKKSTELLETLKSETNSPVKPDALEENSLSFETTKLAENAEILPTSPRKSGRSRKSTSNSKIDVVETVESKVNLPVTSGSPEGESLISETVKVVGNLEILQKSPKKTGNPKGSTLISKTEVMETVQSEANLPDNDSLGFEPSRLVLKNIKVLQELPKKKGRPRKSTLISNNELVETVEPEANLSVNTEALQKNSMGSEASKLVLKKTEILLEPPKQKGRPRKSSLISKHAETVESETNLSVNTAPPQNNSMGCKASQLLLKNIEILQEPPKKRGRPRKSLLVSKTAETMESETNLFVNNETPQNNSMGCDASQLLLKDMEILQEPPKKKGRPRKPTLICNTEVIATVQEDDSLSSERSKLNKESLKTIRRTSKSEANLLVETDALEDLNSAELAEDTEILQKTPKKKGRPRKSTSISNIGVVETAESQSNLSVESKAVEITPPTPTSSCRSKRKRKVVDYSKLSRADEPELESDEDFVLKKPKKRKKLDQDIFEVDVNITPNPQTEEIDCSFSEVNKRNRKEQSKHAKLFYSLVNDAKLNDTSQTLNEETESSDKVTVDVKIKQEKKKSNSSMVTCDVCKLEMEKKEWVNHKLKKHNNLAWKVGEKPLDLNDSKFVLGVLNEMYVNKKNHYYCDKCENVSRSVQGYLSHRSRCQKSTQDLIALQVTCEHCERVMLPVSMYTHLKFCRGLKSNDEGLEETKVQEDSPLPRKRKAAEKASQFITALNEKDDQPKEKNFKYSKKWIENYNFDVVPWAKKIILEQCQEHGSAKCCFKGCEYQNSDWSEIFSHFKECTKKLEGFSCKLCLSTFEAKSFVIEHLKENHSDEFKADINFDDDGDDESNDSYDEENEVENCKKQKDNKGSANLSLFKQTFLLKFTKDLCPISVSKPIVFPSAWKWTFDFCRENFSEPNLFSNWRNLSIQNLNSSKIGTYLPKQKYSACTSVIKCQKYIDPLARDYDWKRFMLFETSKSDSGIFSIFCGGSISAMAWLPTPYKTQICEQILAVAVQPDLETVYKVNQFYSDPGIIQFWNCGSFETAPQLQFCIAHDYNPIWCLEWCPSGCYDVEVKENESRRLGILAVGSGNSNVYLYSVNEPQPTSGKIIKMKPIKQLSLIINTNQCSATLKPHVSKISWTKAAGHQHIAVGYTNGMVALYNLNNLSDLLKYKVDDELEAQQPYLTINAHVHSVTALTLSHINGGCRWLMSASADRTIKYWDLREPTTPITSSSKFVVTDGLWLTHWLCSILSFDDSCNTGITQTSLHQVRNFKSDTCNVMHSNSAIQCIDANDWINGLIQGNAAGEIQAFFPHQLLHGMDNNSKHFKKKKVILNYCRVVEKNISIQERLARENEKLKLMVTKPIEVVDMSKITLNPNRYKPEPATYKGAENKYGVVFCDYQLNKVEQIAATFTDYTNSHKEKYYPTRPNLYPMQSVTKVQFNPNRSAYNYFAAGYQIGFVRIFPMKFITPK